MTTTPAKRSSSSGSRPTGFSVTRPVSQRGQRHNFEVVVYGSGIAGLTYILDLLRFRPHTRIALITKNKISESNSSYAQGGIAAVALPEDSVERHVADTLTAGDGLCHEGNVRRILGDGPARIQDLMDRGVRFDRTDRGFDLALEGGHGIHRIYHVGDETGRSITTALIDRVLSHTDRVSLFENHTAINLITQNGEGKEGASREVLGAYVLTPEGKVDIFASQATVLATGGAGKIFRFTSNPAIATGDGIAMAGRAGCKLVNMPFYQFHPTLLFHEQAQSFLLTEALRGEGAYLLHPETGRRFMEKYDAERMETSTRDIVARAIFTEIEQAQTPYMYLDISHKDPDHVRRHFPMIYQRLLGLGLDLTKDRIPIAPGAHYLCGGVETDWVGHTALSRLLVIGEAACTGLHGANRLASNSLLEGAVMGYRAAEATPTILDLPFLAEPAIADWRSDSVRNLREASQIHSLWASLRANMTSLAGIIRTERGLTDLLEDLGNWSRRTERYYWEHEVTPDAIELRNITYLARILAEQALALRESRGGHYREDYPDHLRI